ncbi:MAG TPA: hypothetical protein VGE72_23360 [Azospirillum sp.]
MEWVWLLGVAGVAVGLWIGDGLRSVAGEMRLQRSATEDLCADVRRLAEAGDAADWPALLGRLEEAGEHLRALRERPADVAAALDDMAARVDGAAQTLAEILDAVRVVDGVALRLDDVDERSDMRRL